MMVPDSWIAPAFCAGAEDFSIERWKKNHEVPWSVLIAIFTIHY
jgi:hypothetical protein